MNREGAIELLDLAHKHLERLPEQKAEMQTELLAARVDIGAAMRWFQVEEERRRVMHVIKRRGYV